MSSNEENNNNQQLKREESEINDDNNNINNSSSENLIKEIKTREIYLISKNMESKILELLLYLKNDINSISNKIIILKYLENLFNKIDYNSEIISKVYQNINIFKVIINQFIINNDEEYLTELKQLFILLISQISLDKETYHYILSFIINYINRCNNNYINDNNIFNSEQLSKIMLLLQLYYQGIQTINEPYNYFYFNGNQNTNILIDFNDNDNFKKKFSHASEINILFFIKLIENDIIKEDNEERNFTLLDVNLKNKEDKENQNNILIGVNKNYFLTTNFTSENLVKLPENKMVSILIKLNIKEIAKTEIFINDEKIEIPKNIIIKEKEKKLSHNKIKQIKFFENFIGICSNIIIFKEMIKDKKFGLPKFFLSPNYKNDKYCIKPILSNGIFKEDLFNFFLKPELKEKVDDISYNNIKYPINEKLQENDIKDIKTFLDDYLICIYMPNRYVLIERNENNKMTLLKDSINDIDAEFITDFPNLNGVHLFKRISEDLIPFGGLNHFIPIIEIMAQNNNLLDNENLFKFFSLLTTIFMPSYNLALKNENNSNFFFNLSYFLEKIPEKYFDGQLASKLISLSASLIYYQNDFLNLIKQFHNDILLNKTIFFKFKLKEQGLILQQIKFLLEMIKNEGFIIDIMLLINIILTYDEDKYNKFCCKSHSEYFNIPSEIYEPELKEILKPVEEVISKLFEIFIREASQSKGRENENGKMLFKLFEMLTLDISPCIQKIIIKYFLNYLKNHYGKYYSFLDTNNRMFDITLFIFKTSIFDIKIDALNLILLMNNMKKYLDDELHSTRRSRTNSWAIATENIGSIDAEKSIFIQNFILPFYLLGEGILMSSSSKNDENQSKTMIISNNINEIISNDEDKDNKKEKKSKKLKKSNFYKIFDEDNKENTRNKTFSEPESLYEDLKNQNNSVCYNYIKINSIQYKVSLNYKKVKMNSMILDLYNNTLNSLKESEQFNFVLNLLIKIVSKSDIILISEFLNYLKNKSNKKSFLDKLYKNQLLLIWLLETSFQSFMIIESNFDEKKFKQGFTIDPVDENSSEKKKILSEEEKRAKIEEVYTNTNLFIIEIINNNIYKNLDLLFSWSKYYYELRNNKNNFQNVKNFIIKILRNLSKSYIILSISEKEDSTQNEYMYYLSFLFEIITFYNFNAEQGNKLKESNQIIQELSYNFPSILLMEVMNQKNMNENNEKKYILNIKWNDYPFYKKIYYFFKPLWSSLTKEKANNERDNINILKKYIGKKNSFINELHILFNTYENLKKSDNANKGIKNIFLIYHFLILLFSIVEDENELNNLYNDFYLFICLLIISSSTVIICDNKKQKWPDESEYQDIQDITELILYNTLNYYRNKIIEINGYIKKYKEEKDEEKIKYYNFFRNILIESLGNILKLLAMIYNEFNESMSSILKLKSRSKPGTYILLKNIYSFFETKENNSSKNLPNVEKKENYINNILKINSKEDNIELEKKINLFIEDISIEKYLYEIIKEDKNLEKLYPFHKIIKLRNIYIKNMIPIYNNGLNAEEGQTNLILVPSYWQESKYNKILEKKIGKINNEFILEIILTKKKVNLETNQKIKEYKKIKKQLFTFKGIWSTEEFFYSSKFEMKYKLLNHYTEDFAKILLTPIVDLDYYLPTFSEFQTETLFRTPENKKPIYYLVDLSFALLNSKKIFNQITNSEENINQEKQENNNDKTIKNLNKTKITKKNALFDLKLINYDFSNESIETKPPTDSTLFSEYIVKKHLYNPEKFDTKVDACLVKPDLHICGIFYNNSHELGFYSSDRTPESPEEYDFSRQVCFGSIFKPQVNKYNYYYIKISYNEIDFVLKRKYYYKKTGLEIFTTNKKSYFFRLDEVNLKIIYENIKHYMKKDIEDICVEYTKFEEKIGFFNKNISIKDSNFYNEKLFQITNNRKNMNLKYLYEKWTKWEISTLKLLNFLNLYANRSFNDINQYPVFPWILLDYQSDNLPKTQILRPFGTPMGMLCFDKASAERKQSFISTWDTSLNEGEEESDRYRSHFSTSLYITYYLVRVFPFSNMRIELQGKNFDDPHRLFNSMKDSFMCASTQRADLRELIPEFFYFPEMFYNLNNFDLGEIKDKVTNIKYKVNDIDMPKWSNKDGYLFINKHRMILESPEVNEQINQWFNIMFGVKQRGEKAKKINNLFLSYTYDEDFEENYDKGDENAKVYYCRMVEFGVTPHQIFKNETNKRLNYNEIKSKKDMFINLTEILKKNEEKNIEIINELELNKDDKNNIFIPVKIYINQKDEEDKKKLYVLDNLNGIIKSLKIEQVQKKVNSSNNNQDNVNNKISIKILQLIDNKKDIKIFIPKNRLKHFNNLNIPSAFYNKGHCIALGGFWNGNILIESISEDNKKDKNEKIDTKIYSTNEKSSITHILIDPNEIFMLCANNLGIIYIYIIDSKDKSLLHLYKTLYDHYSPISSLSFDEKLNIFITCSKDGFCNLYTTPQCKLVNSFNLKNLVQSEDNVYSNISLISSSSLPCFIFYFKSRSSLCVCSINGHFIKEQKIDYDIKNNCIKKFTDNQFNDYLLIIDQKDEVVNIYNIIDLQIVMTGQIKNYIVIDFIFAKDFDNLFVLVKPKNENEKESYKILIMKNTKMPKINQEDKKISQINNEEDINKE